MKRMKVAIVGHGGAHIAQKLAEVHAVYIVDVKEAERVVEEIEEERRTRRQQFEDHSRYLIKAPEPLTFAEYHKVKKKMQGVVFDPVRTEPKVNRNSPCPCGSGKKVKKCCTSKK